MGVLLIACSATAILSAVPLGSTLDGPNYLSKLAVARQCLQYGVDKAAVVLEFGECESLTEDPDPREPPGREG